MDWCATDDVTKALFSLTDVAAGLDVSRMGQEGRGGREQRLQVRLLVGPKAWTEALCAWREA